MFPTQAQKSLALPLTAAALSLLLAACGGGGSTDGTTERAVSANPSATDGAATEALARVQNPTDSSGTITLSLPSPTDASTGADVSTDNGSTDDGSTSSADAATPVSSTTATGNDPGRSQPVVPETQTAAKVSTESTTAAPISSGGVRGDVLLSMMDQKVCQNVLPATSHDGPLLRTEQAARLPATDADVTLAPSTYTRLPGTPSAYSRFFGQINAPCDEKFFAYAPVKDGTYRLDAWTKWSIKNDLRPTQPSRTFRMMTSSVMLTVTGKHAEIGSDAKTSESQWGPRWQEAGEQLAPLEPNLHADRSFSFALDAQVSYGVLNQWTQGNYFTKLMLLPGSTADEARLCWHNEAEAAKRLHCTVWRVPANWQRGERLKWVDQYIVDDRSMVAGESGFLYLRSARR